MDLDQKMSFVNNVLQSLGIADQYVISKKETIEIPLYEYDQNVPSNEHEKMNKEIKKIDTLAPKILKKIYEKAIQSWQVVQSHAIVSEKYLFYFNKINSL